jgi:hypothetical protein
VSEDNDEVEDYDELRKRIKALEAELGRKAWGSNTGGGGVTFSAGDAVAEVENIYQALREERLTRLQEKRLRELRLGPTFERMANDIVRGVS